MDVYELSETTSPSTKTPVSHRPHENPSISESSDNGNYAYDHRHDGVNAASRNFGFVPTRDPMRSREGSARGRDRRVSRKEIILHTLSPHQDHNQLMENTKYKPKIGQEILFAFFDDQEAPGRSGQVPEKYPVLPYGERTGRILEELTII